MISAIEQKAKKAGVRLPAGASEAKLKAAEKKLGLIFPAEVRAFYLRHDGGGDASICDERELLSLERMVDEWTVWKGLLDKGTFEANDHSDPEPGVQQKWWIPQWVPFTYDGSGNHHVIDLAPGKGGIAGQVLSFWHDAGERSVEAPDLLTWLATKAVWGEDPDAATAEGDDESAPAPKAKPKRGKGQPPTTLKAEGYADRAAASSELIVVGAGHSSTLTIWSAAGGTKVIERHEGFNWPPRPAFGGLATLPGARFVMSVPAPPENAVGRDGKTPKDPSTLAIYDADAKRIGKELREKGREFGSLAVSRDGALIAVHTWVGDDNELALWRPDDLINGGKPVRTIKVDVKGGLAFSPDGASVVFFADHTLHIASVATGKVRKVKVKSRVETAALISISTKGVVCVCLRSSTSVFTSEGKVLFEFFINGGAQTPVEQAMITDDEQVIAVSGDPAKHWDKDWVKKMVFPAKGMEQGFVAVFNTKGELQRWAPRAKNKPVRVMAMAPGAFVVMGQDSVAEVLPLPVGKGPG